MKKILMFTLIAIATSIASAKSGSNGSNPVPITDIAEVIKTQYQCDITSASQYKDGQLLSTLDPQKTTMKTFNQDGGGKYDTTKCFIVDMKTADGEDGSLGFGCVELNQKSIREFSDTKLVLERPEYNEIVTIDLQTGSGSRSYNVRMCDWGKNCTTREGSATFANCKKLN